jgi:hypothetical protein
MYFLCTNKRLKFGAAHARGLLCDFPEFYRNIDAALEANDDINKQH